MPLTLAQSQAVRDHVAASGDLNVFPNNSDGNFTVAALLNTAADPAWVVWRTSVTWDEIMLNGMDWTRVDALSVGKARIWDWLFYNAGRVMNPSKANIRAGIDEAWKGTAADLAVRASVYTHCKANATRVQKVLSTGTGSTESPATLGVGITETWRISPAEVETARNLN